MFGDWREAYKVEEPFRVALEMKGTRRSVLLGSLGLLSCRLLRAFEIQQPVPPLVQEKRFSVPLVDCLGNIVSRYDASALYFLEDLGAGVKLEMTQIPGGNFLMGSTDPPPSLDPSSAPIHGVKVAPFSLGTYAVTREQWRAVAALPRVTVNLHSLPSLDLPADVANQIPVDLVSAAEADEFCLRLKGRTGRDYLIPSEPRVEYGFRVGTSTQYHFGDGVSLQVANFDDLQRPLSLTPVGSKQAPNRFGLHDMHGNILEWCADYLHQNYEGAPQDGSAWLSGADPIFRIARGGMYLWIPAASKSAYRSRATPVATFSGLGFRVAANPSTGFTDPIVSSAGVVNAAAFSNGPVAPGEIISIFGAGIGPAVPASLSLDSAGKVATKAGGSSVLFDGIASPMIFASTGQINVIVPYSVAGKQSVQLSVNSQGQTSAPISLGIVPSAPGLFTITESGNGQTAALNQDSSANSSARPAARGSLVSLVLTGEGQTDPSGIDGQIAKPPYAKPLLPVEVMIGGFLAEVSYAGGAPGEVAGVMQVNARVPASAPSGNQTITVKVGAASSQPDVTLAVQ